MYLKPHHRIAILLHQGLQGAKGKTGISLLRYSPQPIVAIIDETCPGADVRKLTGIDRQVPVVASIQEALTYQPDVLAIGLAPSGGALPAPWYNDVKQAVDAGLSVMNGLHTEMGNDPDLVNHLQDSQWIWDVRREPDDLSVGSGEARTLSCHRVLTVGTDMAVGKMSTSIELNRASQRQGLRSKLIATGQTGLMLGEDGIALDAIRVDFASGAIESLMLRYGPDYDVLYIEGQGSLMNPASTATLPLMRGSQPTHLVLVHKVNLHQLQHFPAFTIPSLKTVIQVYETLAAAGGTFAPAKVVGIALNTFGVSQTKALAAIEETSQETGLPCTDVVRFGADPILKAIMAN
jgi:uncharacterized NAD-dependent epimerase/dehydratase family protein